MGSGPQLIGCNQQQAQEVEQDQPVCPGSSGNWTQIPSVRVSWGRCGRETCSQSEWVSETTDLIVQRYFSSAQFQLCLLSVSIFSTVAAQFWGTCVFSLNSQCRTSFSAWKLFGLSFRYVILFCASSIFWFSTVGWNKIFDVTFTSEKQLISIFWYFIENTKRRTFTSM